MKLSGAAHMKLSGAAHMKLSGAAHMKLGSAAPATSSPAASGRTIRLGGRSIPVVGPSWRDPRLQVAAVIVAVQVLGQTSLRFQVSIAQILVSILTCAVLEVAITLWRRQALVWPASAMLTGNGVALLLRVNGTRHGDWWTLYGAGYFALAAALSLGSKYLIRRGDRHLFNPSNFGLVVVFLTFGTRVLNPQDLWWGPMSPGLALALVLILAGGVAICARLRLFGLVAAFWATFAAGTGFVTAGGHCISARWSLYPVCGGSFWSVLALSPEILVFMFFMITDPKTIPSGRVARVAYGGAVGFLAALAIAPATTEFWTKVGVLSALIVVCAGRPLIERVLPSPGDPSDDLRTWLRMAAAKGRGRGRGIAVVAAGVLVPLLAVALLALAALPSRSAAAAGEAVVAAAAAGATPEAPLAISPPPVPRVTIGSSVGSFKTSITQAAAERLATELADDLAIEAQAWQTSDVALAGSADTGAWLATVTGAINKLQPAAQPELRTYTFTRMTLDLVANPARPQNPPAVEIQAAGATSTGAGAPTPFATTFSLTSSAGAYLISGESPPVGP